MSPRVAFLTPFAFPSVRGNAVTVERIAAGLRRRGVELSIWDLSATDEATVAAELEAFRPTVVHAFHAFRVGPLALLLARRVEVPLVVTLTGTDANHDLWDAERAPHVRRVLEGAARVIAFHPSIVERVVAALPDLRRRFVVVPQSAWLAVGEPFDLAARVSLPTPRVLFLFPAAVRGVKRPRRPLAAFDALVARHPHVRLLYAGPVADPEEGEALAAALRARPWARQIGVVAHTQMASLLSQTDVIMNCSLTEGGMANAVLEALAVGRPVLASDIEGNRSLVEDGVTGLLFADDGELEAKAERLVTEPALRARLGAAGRELVARRYSTEQEIAGYLDVYRDLAPVPAS